MYLGVSEKLRRTEVSFVVFGFIPGVPNALWFLNKFLL